MGALRSLAISLLLSTLGGWGAAAATAERVDLILVLAADVSRSIDASKFHLQREGYAQAMTNPQVIEAIRSGPHGSVGLCFVEWSGASSQKLVIDWTRVFDTESAHQFSDGIVEAPRSFADRTAISGGIDFAMSQLERAPFESTRRAIDVSGDGTNNSGREVTAARDDAIARGATINGLVILSAAPLPWNPEHTNPPGGLAEYYRRNVVGGPSAFVMVADDFGSFGQALVKKLLAEIAGTMTHRGSAILAKAAPPR
jgi:hypothetical protein